MGWGGAVLPNVPTPHQRPRFPSSAAAAGADACPGPRSSPCPGHPPSGRSRSHGGGTVSAGTAQGAAGRPPRRPHPAGPPTPCQQQVHVQDGRREGLRAAEGPKAQTGRADRARIPTRISRLRRRSWAVGTGGRGAALDKRQEWPLTASDALRSRPETSVLRRNTAARDAWETLVQGPRFAGRAPRGPLGPDSLPTDVGSLDPRPRGRALERRPGQCAPQPEGPRGVRDRPASRGMPPRGGPRTRSARGQGGAEPQLRPGAVGRGSDAGRTRVGCPPRGPLAPRLRGRAEAPVSGPRRLVSWWIQGRRPMLRPLGVGLGNAGSAAWGPRSPGAQAGSGRDTAHPTRPPAWLAASLSRLHPPGRSLRGGRGGRPGAGGTGAGDPAQHRACSPRPARRPWCVTPPGARCGAHGWRSFPHGAGAGGQPGRDGGTRP